MPEPTGEHVVLPLTVRTYVEGGVLQHVEVVDATGAEVEFVHDHTDHDDEDARLVDRIDPLSDVTEDQHVPDPPDDDGSE